MPNECPECEEEVRPLAQEFNVQSDIDEDSNLPVTNDEGTVWFLVCPKCHYVFERYDEDDFTTAPR